MDSSLNPRNAVRAITLRRPYAIVYCALDRGEWIVQPRGSRRLVSALKNRVQDALLPRIGLPAKNQGSV